MTLLGIVQKPARKRHIFDKTWLNGSVHTMCNLTVNPCKSSFIRSIDLAGGATTRFMTDLHRVMDDTFCLRCAHVAVMAQILHETR